MKARVDGRLVAVEASMSNWNPRLVVVDDIVAVVDDIVAVVADGVGDTAAAAAAAGRRGILQMSGWVGMRIVMNHHSEALHTPWWLTRKVLLCTGYTAALAWCSLSSEGRLRSPSVRSRPRCDSVRAGG